MQGTQLVWYLALLASKSNDLHFDRHLVDTQQHNSEHLLGTFRLSEGWLALKLLPVAFQSKMPASHLFPALGELMITVLVKRA